MVWHQWSPNPPISCREQPHKSQTLTNRIRLGHKWHKRSS
ncbi:unnamed protein product [Choristocarpus tenellus]